MSPTSFAGLRRFRIAPRASGGHPGSRLGGFLVFLCLALAPLSAAQPAGKVARIGSRSNGPVPSAAVREAFWKPLRELGWIEGQNVVIDRRTGEGRHDRLPGLAAELVRSRPDLIVALGQSAATAVRQATTTIPIVFCYVADPVAIGLVASLSRPGGNATGLTDRVGPELGQRRLQMLRELVPGASRVAYLTRPLGPADAPIEPWVTANLDGYHAAARALGIQVLPWRVQGPADIQAAFDAMVQQKVGALDVADWQLLGVNRRQIIDLAARYRLPTIYPYRFWAVDGGLMAYGVDADEVPRRLAVYMDRVLKGARPADLPVEQPTKFELVINQSTAKALGVTFPRSLLEQAELIR
jgi:putative ABC transport system substrate-binding protein